MSLSANDLNIKLRNLYLEKLPEIYRTIATHAKEAQLADMHGPFMIEVQPEYLLSSKKSCLLEWKLTDGESAI